MKNILVVFFCLLVFSFSSYGQKASSLKQMKWLAGHWQGTYKNAPFYESWIYVHDSLMVNLAIEIKNNDTVVKENGFIRIKNGSIIHGGADATWQLAKLNDTEMIFENDTLKYANKIIWSHSVNDHWLTEIHNPNNVIIKYDLVRVPWLEKFVTSFINKNRKG